MHEWAKYYITDSYSHSLFLYIIIDHYWYNCIVMHSVKGLQQLMPISVFGLQRITHLKLHSFLGEDVLWP